MPGFEYSEGATKATSTFLAHKFPYTKSVYYQCHVRLCHKPSGGCDDIVSGRFFLSSPARSYARTSTIKRSDSIFTNCFFLIFPSHSRPLAMVAGPIGVDVEGFRDHFRGASGMSRRSRLSRLETKAPKSFQASTSMSHLMSREKVGYCCSPGKTFTATGRRKLRDSFLSLLLLLPPSRLRSRSSSEAEAEYAWGSPSAFCSFARQRRDANNGATAPTSSRRAEKECVSEFYRSNE